MSYYQTHIHKPKAKSAAIYHIKYKTTLTAPNPHLQTFSKANLPWHHIEKQNQYRSRRAQHDRQVLFLSLTLQLSKSPTFIPHWPHLTAYRPRTEGLPLPSSPVSIQISQADAEILLGLDLDQLKHIRVSHRGMSQFVR